MPHSIAFTLPEGTVGFGVPIMPSPWATLRLPGADGPGTYVYFCPIGNHQQLGIVGRLVVGESDRAGAEVETHREKERVHGLSRATSCTRLFRTVPTSETKSSRS